MKIEFGEWLPDQPALDNPGCIEAKNVVPRINAFSQLNSPVAFSNALTSACLGATWMNDQSGNSYNFAGDSTKLYKHNRTTATWDNVSRTATYSTATSWNFEKFGTLCLATDVGNPLQYFDMASSTTFQNVGGSPPQARYIATIRDFVVLGNLSGNPYRVQWSGYNNAELWTPSLSTQSDFQDLPGSGGDVQAVVPGEYGVIFQENSIW